MTDDGASLSNNTVPEEEEIPAFIRTSCIIKTNKYIPRVASEIQSTCFHCKETTLRLVFTTTLKKSRFQCLFDSSFFRQNPGFLRGRRNERGRGALSRMQHLGKLKPRERDGKGRAKGSGRQGLRKHQNEPPIITMDTSVAVTVQWPIVAEMDFPSLAKLSLPEVKDGKDIVRCGSLEYYDKTYDTVNVKSEKPLQRSDRIFHRVTTSDDPFIRLLAQSKANVYATDAILATIMCCTRSNDSWDIVITKIGDQLFFDKGPNTEYDLLTVNETSVEPPQDGGSSLNSPRNLAIEATIINHNFSQQVLQSNESRYKFQMGNPFISEEEEEQGDAVSVAYLYRKWDLKNGIVLVARCEHDAVMQGPNNETQFLTIKAFNEWNSKLSTGVDWRQKLDTERDAVLKNELRNNACKVAKWTVQALLAGSDQLKFGYVSRATVRDTNTHVILGTQQYKPNEFATEIKLNMDNAWGILQAIIDVCMKCKDGKYLIMKDTNIPMIRLYHILDGPIESEGEEEEDDDEPVNDAFQVIG